MDSMPPATMISLVPEARRSCANIAAFIPEPHILFTVVQPVASGKPAPREAWRAGAWPWPAGSTQPMMTSCTSSGRIFARSTAARMAIGSGFMEQSFQVPDGLGGFGLEARDQLGGGQGARERRRLARPHV